MASLEGHVPASIFTTLRYDPDLYSNATNTVACGGQTSPVYMMAYHYDRLQEAAATLARARPSAGNRWLRDLQQPDQIAQVCTAHLQREVCGSSSEYSTAISGAWRCAVSLDVHGAITVKSASAQQAAQPLLFPAALDHADEPTWIVVLDSQPTDLVLITSIKTSDREIYDRPRRAAGILSPAATKEVLLYNPDNQIMDGSITTPYFLRDGKWVTPPATSGGQQGVTRRWALRQGLCSEVAVSKHSLKDGETVWLSNAFRGFFPAMFREQHTSPDEGP